MADLEAALDADVTRVASVTFGDGGVHIEINVVTDCGAQVLHANPSSAICATLRAHLGLKPRCPLEVTIGGVTMDQDDALCFADLDLDDGATISVQWGSLAE